MYISVCGCVGVLCAHKCTWTIGTGSYILLYWSIGLFDNISIKSIFVVRTMGLYSINQEYIENMTG